MNTDKFRVLNNLGQINVDELNRLGNFAQDSAQYFPQTGEYLQTEFGTLYTPPVIQSTLPVYSLVDHFTYAATNYGGSGLNVPVGVLTQLKFPLLSGPGGGDFAYDQATGNLQINNNAYYSFSVNVEWALYSTNTGYLQTNFSSSAATVNLRDPVITSELFANYQLQRWASSGYFTNSFTEISVGVLNNTGRQQTIQQAWLTFYRQVLVSS